MVLRTAAYVRNYGYMIVYIGIILVVSGVALTQADFPHYKLRFGIFYNSSGVEAHEPQVRTPCGTYYAEQFLGVFIEYNEWMTRECRESGVEGGLRIQIPNRATVKLFRGQVEVSVDIYLFMDGGSQQDLITCGNVINASLQHPETIGDTGADDGESTFLDKIRYLDEEDKTNCSSAVMSPATFYFQESVWRCGSANYTFSAPDWTCAENVDGTEEGTDETIQDPEIYTTNPKDLPATTANNDIAQNLTTSEPESTTQPQIFVSISPSTKMAPPHKNVSSETNITSTPDGNGTINHRDNWGIDLLDRPRTIWLEEGHPGTLVDLHLWVNRVAICQGESHCTVSFDASIAGGAYSSPICRKTGQLIPQVVLGRPTRGHVSGTPFCSIPMSHDVSSRNTSLVLRAVSDNKYDGRQHRQLTLSMTVNRGTEVYGETFHRVQIVIEDHDRKATCQSINDPHISTFDGLQYNNYYEGEFVLYSHKELPATVHVVYQKCSHSVQASCNCAVAVQSGDDVIVIDRCFRDKRHLQRIGGGAEREINPMTVKLLLNDKLTPGTRIYQEAEGKKYFIYLPHGAYVKVIVSGMLVNAWIVASPDDLNKTKGLCGVYDRDKKTDMVFPNGTLYHDADILAGSREQPVPVMMEWRVDIGSPRSLLQGVQKLRIPYEPPRYCQCQEDATRPYCAHGAHVDNCDVIQGEDVTDFLVKHAEAPRVSQKSTRGRRDIEDNTISVIARDDPIRINKDFVPPKYKWGSHSKWNEVMAKDFCTQYIRDNYTIGQLCARIVPAVNFKQEIDSCTEDIQITGSTGWASNARHAMKEQCLEEIQKNSSLPNDVADRLQGAMCFNDCYGRGDCVRGKCNCMAGYTSADCSISETQSPYAGELPHYGLCDIRNMNCSRVIVYGENFVESKSLTCYFQECEVDDGTCRPVENQPTGNKGLFINFNAVECNVPKLKPYLVSISNNGGMNRSEPLLFIPFDPNCRVCSTFNTSCTKLRNSCIIDGLCYAEGESSPEDKCLVCEPINNELQWTTQDGMSCKTPWWEYFKLPSWAVAVPAAIGGSIVGVLVGFLLYKCCCKNNKQRDPGVADLNPHHGCADDTPFEDAILHRNRSIPTFSGDRFGDLGDLPQPEQPQDFNNTYFYNDGRGVENGVDSTTYF